MLKTRGCAKDGAFHRGRKILRFRCDGLYHDNVEYAVYMLGENEWVAGPCDGDVEEHYKDLGPFSTPEEALIALKLVSD